MAISNVFGGGGGTASAETKQKTEDLSSECDGEKTVFTTSFNYLSAHMKVYWNGLRQSPNDFVVSSSNRLTTLFTAQSGDDLIIDYLRE